MQAHIKLREIDKSIIITCHCPEQTLSTAHMLKIFHFSSKMILKNKNAW
jgi:hypothetical protein